MGMVRRVMYLYLAYQDHAVKLKKKRIDDRLPVRIHRIFLRDRPEKLFVIKRQQLPRPNINTDPSQLLIAYQTSCLKLEIFPSSILHFASCLGCIMCNEVVDGGKTFVKTVTELLIANVCRCWKANPAHRQNENLLYTSDLE